MPQAATAGFLSSTSPKSAPSAGDGFTYEHLDDREEAWVDFIADTGDGGHSTYSVDRALASPYLAVSPPDASQVREGRRERRWVNPLCPRSLPSPSFRRSPFAAASSNPSSDLASCPNRPSLLLPLSSLPGRHEGRRGCMRRSSRKPLPLLYLPLLHLCLSARFSERNLASGGCRR